MNDTNSLGGAFLRLLIWRGVRNTLYRVMGSFRPGWRRALVMSRICDAYADKGTLNMPLYSDPRFEANLRTLEAEVRRLRRGGEPRFVNLPYDFPPGTQDMISRSSYER